MKAGYFDQMLSGLDPDEQALDAVRPSHKEFVEQQRRDLLARFGVTGDMVFQKVGSLSGGERNRTALARLSASDANFLILDEPTNHLDLWARGSLEKALCEFDGSVLFVSHDRYFLNQVATKLLIVEPGRFRVIDGNYDTYLHFVKQGLAREARAASPQRRSLAGTKPGPGVSRDDTRRQQTRQRAPQAQIPLPQSRRDRSRNRRARIAHRRAAPALRLRGSPPRRQPDQAAQGRAGGARNRPAAAV